MKSFLRHKALLSVLIAILVVNQIAIGSVSQAMGATSGLMSSMLGVKTASASEIMMPILNQDGTTTYLRTMPTITEVLGESGSGDVVADAMAVMLATGTPFYAPNGITFDDPVAALSAWKVYDSSIELTDDQEDRYQRLISIFPCNFCCGSPNRVTVAGRCGCAHAGAARGFLRYMISTYGDTYSDDELVGEGYRWQALWYPAGVVEDYLLATGRGDVLGHSSHGGVGEDGMHGVTQ